MGSKGMGPWALTGALKIEDSWRNRMQIREGVKKNGKKAVRLTAWVDPPSPEAVRKM